VVNTIKPDRFFVITFTLELGIQCRDRQWFILEIHPPPPVCAHVVTMYLYLLLYLFGGDVLQGYIRVNLCSIKISLFQGVYVENLSEFVVGNTAEVLSLLKLGKKKLIMAETRMNRVSSR